MFLPLAGGAAPAEAAPTPLLTLVAGEFAPLVAPLCPPPHAAFLTAPAARRHLVCLAFAFERDEAADAVLHARMPEAMRFALGRRPPPGLARALSRMGETAWTAGDYGALVDMLGEPRAAKALWHADRVEPALVRNLAALPVPMSGAAHLAMALEPGGVAVVREAFEAIRFRRGDAAADRAAARWARVATVAALFEAVRDELYGEPAPPPHPGTALLRPLASRADFRRAAVRYRNCLMGQLPYAISGWSAFYEWMGEPGAVVEVTRDHLYGWRLEQARMAGNEPVPFDLQWAITRELEAMGLYVGRSGWELDRAVSSHGGGGFALRPASEALGEVFGHV